MKNKCQLADLLSYKVPMAKLAQKAGQMKKRQATRLLSDKSMQLSWKHRFFILTLLGFFAIVLGGGYWLLQVENFPIERVKLMGAMAHSEQEQLKKTILPHTQKGFFSVNVSKLQEELLLLPWIRQVDVRRVWPGQLVVHIAEHEPVAVWNDTSLISREEILFSPDLEDIQLLDLPKLYGPSNKQQLVWKQYLVMKQKVAALQLSINSLELATRGAWQLQLSNQIQIKLGTQDVLVRLQRFVDAYQHSLRQNADQIAYVDLRYTNGMAVGWTADAKVGY